MEFLITAFLVTLLVSFVCSLVEAVLLSLTQSYVAVLKKQNKSYGLILDGLKSNIDRPLAAILTLNTVSHTVGAAAIGARVQSLYGDDYLTISSAILTVAILLLAEIIPKKIGASYWKHLAAPTAHMIRILILITYPIVWLSEILSARVRTADNLKMSREEMIVSAEIGEREGAIHTKEARVIKNLLRLNKILVQDVMTPRSVTIALPKTLTVDEVMNKFATIPFSRIPVYEKNMDDISGVVLRFRILQSSANDDHTMTLAELAQPVYSISGEQSVADALDEMIRRQEHVFMVLDPHGTTVGIISLEDCIETLLGVEIVDEFDSVEDMRQFAAERWEKRKQARLAGKKLKDDGSENT